MVGGRIRGPIPPLLKEMSKEQQFDYWAFISYSHSDEAWAKWLHKALERYRIPGRFVGKTSPSGDPVPRRIYPIFKDRDELPSSSDLSQRINHALRSARYLIVICSPRAATSKWVNAEVSYFKSLGREDRVLALIVEGEPNAAEKGESQGAALECFPAPLCYRLDARGGVSGERVEPVAADVRRGKDRRGEAVIRLVAGIIGVGYNDLRRRDARRKRLTVLAAACGLVFAILGSVLLWAQFNKLSNEKEALRPKPPPPEVLAEQGIIVRCVEDIKQISDEIKLSTTDFAQEISLGSDGIFQVGSGELEPNGKAAIGELTDCIRSHELGHLREIQVYAHTDQVPVKNYASNWQLSAARSIGVVRALIDRGIDPSVITLTPIAPGEFVPLTTGEGGMDHRLNRRVRLKLIYSDTPRRTTTSHK